MVRSRAGIEYGPRREVDSYRFDWQGNEKSPCELCGVNFAKPGSDPPRCRACLADPSRKFAKPLKDRIASADRKASRKPRCNGTWLSGVRCKKFAIEGDLADDGKNYCRNHHPDPEIVKKQEDRYQQSLLDLKYGTNPRMQALFLGELSVEELDDEELIRAMPRQPSGKFGRPSKVLPRELHTRCVQELFARADARMQARILDVVDTMLAVATSEQASDSDRLKASQWIFERLRGKSPDTLIHRQEKPFEAVFSSLTGARSARADRPEELVTYAEVVEEEEKKERGLKPKDLVSFWVDLDDLDE